MSNQENNIPDPRIEEISKAPARNKELITSQNQRQLTRGGRMKPRFNEPFAVEGKRQPELDRALLEKNTNKGLDEAQSKANQPQKKPTSAKSKGVSKIGAIFRNGAKALGNIIKLGNPLAVTLGTAYEFLNPPSTATDEQEKEHAQQYRLEQEGAKENQGFQNSDKQELPVQEDKFNDNLTQVDKDQLIDSLSNQLELNKEFDQYEPTFEQKDQLISSFQSDDIEGYELNENTYDLSSLDKDKLIEALKDSDSIEIDGSFYFEEKGDVSIGDDGLPDIDGGDGGGGDD